jgi:hypothetical protein
MIRKFVMLGVVALTLSAVSGTAGAAPCRNPAGHRAACQSSPSHCGPATKQCGHRCIARDKVCHRPG